MKESSYYYRHKNAGLCVNCNEQATRGIRCDKHAEANRTKALDSIHKIRLKVFTYYCGGSPYCQCPGCRNGKDNPVHVDALQLDHIHGRGREHVRELSLGKGAARFWAWVVKNGYPDGFQVLCANCNGPGAKGNRSQCPMAGQEH